MATLFIYRSTRPKNLSFLTGLSVMLAVLAGVSFWGAHHISAASCTTNDIMKCGFSTPSDFISKVEANNNGINSNADLQSVYAHYGLSTADYNDFAAHAVQGEAMRNGDIVVNGKVVGTGGMSIGRLKSFQGSNPFSVSIAGQTYWGNVNSQAFASGVSEIPVFVLLDSSGGMKFAVMPSCGNPEFPASKPAPTPPTPSSAACKVLNTQPVQGQQNTFSFTAAAAQTGNVTITRFVYDFGDGTPTQTETSGDTPVTHTYTSSGTFTAKVTVFARISSGDEQQLPAVVTCSKQITIAPPQQPPPPPPAPVLTGACKELVAIPKDDSGSKLSFTFTATAVPNSSLTLSGGDFDFGDGNTQQNEPPNSDGMTVSVDHTYASAGTFTASAVLHFTDKNDANKSVTAPACTTVVTPVEAAAPPPPQPPVQQATVTTVLPNTGAGNVIGLFFAVTAIGTFIFRQMLLRRAKGE